MKLIVAFFAVLCCSSVASADIIDFEDSGVFPPMALTAPVTVGEFVISGAANAEVSSNLSTTLSINPPGASGNPTRGVYAGDGGLALTLTITRVGGRLFEFIGLDWGFDSGSTFSTLSSNSTVSNGGALIDIIQPLGTLGDTAFSTFSPTLLAGQSISQLDISFSPTLAPLAPGNFGLDNIELTPVGASVPEPSSFALLMVGGFGYWGVRRRRWQCNSASV